MRKTRGDRENHQMTSGRDRRRVLRTVAVAGLGLGGVGTVSGSGGGSDAGGGSANTITVIARTAHVEYRFGVSGEVRKGPNSGTTDEIVNGNTVRGLIETKGERDNYAFTGQIESFEVTAGEVAVYVNGERLGVVRAEGGGDADEGASGGSDAPSATGFVIEQGGACAPIQPLSYEDQSVTEFYGYTSDLSAPNPRQSNTPTGLERMGVSRLFLYRGPDGLSLVIIHGSGEPGGGGSATFEIGGLPSGGEFVVRDDDYEGTRDVFDVGDTAASIDWAWGAGGRNDGAAFNGLGDEFSVTIDPAFNEAAARDPLGDGQVESWQILSGSATDPATADLRLDQPVTIRTGSCG